MRDFTDKLRYSNSIESLMNSKKFLIFFYLLMFFLNIRELVSPHKNKIVFVASNFGKKYHNFNLKVLRTSPLE